MIIEIREERQSDVAAIREVNRQAFGQDLEGRVVDELRTNGAVLLSLVAVVDGAVVGHAMYSAVSIGVVAGAGLGPMAVLPGFQRHGIGSKLIEEGNSIMQKRGCPFVVVLGHSAYYPRFGFLPARRQGITCEWDVPDEVFMILVLDAATMRGVTGTAKYRPEFSAVS
jgi:putative acetyltransferase